MKKARSIPEHHTYQPPISAQSSPESNQELESLRMAVSTSTIQRTKPRRARYIHDSNPVSLISFNPVQYSDISTQTTYSTPPQEFSVPPELQEPRSATPTNQQMPSDTTSIAQTCYDIDAVICALTPETLEWRNLDKTNYLTSEPLIARWESGFSALADDFLRGIFTPDVFAAKLEEIMPAVKKLEEARDEGRGILDQRIWKALNRRCGVLEEGFRALERRLTEINMEG